MAFKFICLLACVSVSVASPQLTGFAELLGINSGIDDQSTTTTTPVPILRHINTQTADGSYTYGYENGDGTYKIETRYANGEVRGKYGYYDDTGVLREVEYGATNDGGFVPTGNGLNLPDAPVATAAPVTHFAPTPAPSTPVTSINGRRVKVVRRGRPVKEQARSSQPLRTNDPRINLPSRRRQGGEIINRNLPIRPATTAEPSRFSHFGPQEAAAPAFRPQQPAPEKVLRTNDPRIHLPGRRPQQAAAPAFRQPAVPGLNAHAQAEAAVLALQQQQQDPRLASHAQAEAAVLRLQQQQGAFNAQQPAAPRTFVPQQPAAPRTFVPQQPAAPVAFLPQSSGVADSNVSDIDLETGSYTISYSGR